MRLRRLVATREALERGVARALVVGLAFGTLSCASPGPATRPAPAIERGAVRPSDTTAAQVARAPVARPAPPAPSTAPVQTAPLAAAPPAVVTAPLAEPDDTRAGVAPGAAPSMSARVRPPPSTSDSVALILPLEVPAYARAAEAVRAGFLAAADAAGLKDKCIVIGHKADGVLAAFEAARARGVRVIVGPLLRDDLKTLAIADPDIPWTIALNRLDDDTTLPPVVYAFPLAVESDARLIAHRALGDGVRAIDVVAGGTPLTTRMANAFTAEWIAGGGAPPASLRFDPSADGLSQLKRTLAGALPDAVVLALDGGDAALAKPFVNPLPAYASGLLFERPDVALVRDLNDLRVVEVPWLVTPDAPELAAFPRTEWGSAALDRLYALGLDAFRVSQAFGESPPERFTLDGATGRVTLGDGRQFLREGRFGVYRDGKLVPLDDPPR